MIFETAIGDAYAVAWEFVPADKLPVHDWTGYKQRPKTGDREPSPAATFTDDTLRTIANARVILSGEVLDPLAYVREIKRVFREDPRQGWSKNFQNFLRSQADQPDEAWFSAMSPRNTNGALMGAAVMGVMPNARAAAEAGRLQALVTHDDEAGNFAAAVSLASFAVRTGACGQKSLLDFVMDNDLMIEERLRIETARTDRVDMSAARTAGAILHILTHARSQREILDMTIRMGGDTDSVGAAALGIASYDPETYAVDLPTWTTMDLEGKEAGAQTRRMLRRLDQELVAMTVSNELGVPAY